MISERGLGTVVMLPTYNERSTLPDTIAGIREVLPAADILVIDDGSPDGTGEVAEALAAAGRGITVHHRAGKQGLGTAYVWGFTHALSHGYRFAVEMDSDGSHRPSDLPALLAAAETGAGLVIGARWVPGGRIDGWPWYRRYISRLGTWVARVSLKSRLHDLTSGFRVLDTEWLRRLDLSEIASQGYGFQVETAWALERIGCPVAEVPITFVERVDGRSKMSCSIVIEALCGVLVGGWRLRFGKHRSAPRPKPRGTQ